MIEKKIMTCPVCPNACKLTAEIEDDEVLDVYGNRCMRGMAYAQREALNPPGAKKSALKDE